LSLFVSWIRANDVKPTVAFDDLAIVTAFFN